MKTLADIPRQVTAGTPLAVALGDFLDRFYLRPDAALLAAEPALTPKTATESAMLDAYLAGMAEFLARRYGMPIPAWVFGPERWLHRPYFASTAASLRATLIIESPGEFRGRNIFVTANALDRASRYSTDAAK